MTLVAYHLQAWADLGRQGEDNPQTCCLLETQQVAHGRCVQSRTTSAIARVASQLALTGKGLQVPRRLGTMECTPIKGREDACPGPVGGPYLESGCTISVRSSWKRY